MLLTLHRNQKGFLSPVYKQLKGIIVVFFQNKPAQKMNEKN